MVAQIRPSQLPDWFAQAHNDNDSAHPPLVLDVREAWELQTASVRPEGFELLHIPMALVPMRLQELASERPIACLCHHGGRSMQVAYFLAQHGYAQVANIAGGIHAWAQECDPSIPCY